MNAAPERLHLEKQLAFAAELAREAGEITLHYFRKGVKVESKADASPVTVADRETEQFLRKRIAEKYPEDGILGEEFGATNSGARRRWILDPIDGTQSFIMGLPLYTVLIALEVDGDAKLGVIHNPMLAETAAAAVGLGCTFNGAPCVAHNETDLARARVHVTDYADFTRRRPRFSRAVLGKALMGRGAADAYSHLLMATGRADCVFDPIMNLWDSAALKPVITEAGGVFMNFDGGSSIYAPNAISLCAGLREEVLALIALDEVENGEGEAK